MRVSLAAVREKVNDPVLTDRSVDLLALGTWICFTGWGVASAIAGLPTISIVTNSIYEVVWGSTIACTAAMAAVATASTFTTTTDIASRIRKKQIEQSAVSVLGGFLSVYPIFIIALAAMGDQARVATIFPALMYLLFPTWRVRHLGKRIRKLRSV